MFRSFLICFFIILNSISINAQNYELGKVTIKELEEKQCSEDTTAPAAILFKKGYTYFNYNSLKGFIASHVYEFKIKIYKKEGLSWANQAVSYYVGYENLNDDTVKFSQAATYNLEDGKIVKTKLNNEGNFKNKENKYWNKALITLPNVKVGSVIEFKYVLSSENLVRLPNFDFQYSIPVNYFEYKTEIPEFFIYKTLLVGGLKIQSDANVSQISQVYGTGYKQINSFYSGTNIPALKTEKYIDNIDNYLGSIQNELERERFPNKPIVDYTKTWEGVAKTIYQHSDFGNELKQRDYFQEDLKLVVQKTNSPREKLNAIFKFVQSRMNWNQHIGFLADKGVKKAYAEKVGNVAEINFILISMLRAAQISTHPVLVSTIENGIPVFPNRTVFNYVIAAAEIDGHQILLDAANQFTTPDILSLNLLNWKGRLIKEDGSSSEIELIPTNFSKTNYTLITEINPDKYNVEGTLKIKNTDYNALKFRQSHKDQNNTIYIEKLENELNGIQIEDYKIENNTADLSKPVSEDLKFTFSNAYDVIDGKLFIKPLFFLTQNKNRFLQEKRQMPVYFGFPEQENYNVYINVPDGYTVESLPNPVRFVMENKEASYAINMIHEDNRIMIKIVSEINRTIFAPDEYDMLKEFFQKIIESQNEKIVLKKA